MATITPQQRDSLMSQARAIQAGIDRLKQSGANSKPVAPESNKRVRENSRPIATTDIQTKTAPLPIRDMNPNLANQGISQSQQVSAKFQPAEGSFEAQKQDVNDNVLSILQQQIEGLSNVENNRVTSAESFRQAQNESGILQKQERSNQLQGQLNEVVSRGQANQLAVVGQGRGIPEAILGGQQAQFARETAIESLPISAQLSAAQGDLEMAQRNVETLFKIKTEDAKANYDFNVKVINMVSEFATGQENTKLSDIKMKEERKYKEIERGYTELSNASQMAFANGQSALGGKINQLDYKSPTFKADLAKLQGQLKDPMQALDRQLKGLQISKLRNEIDGTSTDIVTQTLPNGQVDVVDEVSRVIKASGKDVAGASDVVGVLASLQKIAKDNPEGEFIGAAKGVRFGQFRGGNARNERLSTQGDIEAINLKVQQWASGAALTDTQTEQVKRLAPDKNDTDFQIREKINNLTFFMQQQVRSELAAKGIQYTPTPVDYFAVKPELSELSIDAFGNIVIPGDDLSNEDFFSQ